MQDKKDHFANIVYRLSDAAFHMNDLATGDKQYYEQGREAELARLIFIIITPDPITGAGNGMLFSSGTIAKDALLFTLEAIARSSDAFPPLKSAASGLLFFATRADMASTNKKQIRDIHKRVIGLAASLKRGASQGSLLVPEHQDAISALADDIAVLNNDLEDIVNQRKGRLRRFFAAKRHKSELQDITTQLETARMNYMMAMATLNATTIADVRAHVCAYTLVVGTTPVFAPGARRMDDLMLAISTSCVEGM
ncbi:unnamed protein product [Peniophora sp. CBMAI 1063]|nr:unnamed protein product [Peniophora sp. CBMAI 1063]